jgi:plastocyanin
MLLGAILLWGMGGAPSRTHVLKITGFQFLSPRIHLAVGATLTWGNEDIVPHTATAVAGAWDSGTIAAKGTVVAEENRAPSAMTARRAQREFSPLRLLQASLL